MAFNQSEYISNYRKEKYKTLSIDFLKEEVEEINDFCKKNKISKREIFLEGYKKVKNDQKCPKK